MSVSRHLLYCSLYFPLLVPLLENISRFFFGVAIGGKFHKDFVHIRCRSPSTDSFANVENYFNEVCTISMYVLTQPKYEKEMSVNLCNVNHILIRVKTLILITALLTSRIKYFTRHFILFSRL